MYWVAKLLAITIAIIAAATYYSGEIDRALLIFIIAGLLDISADLRRPTQEQKTMKD